VLALEPQNAADTERVIATVAAALGRSEAGAQLQQRLQQRVAAARALIGQPELVIADEPTSALATDAREAFLELLFAECRDAGSSLLFVSHDRHFLAELSNRVLELTPEGVQVFGGGYTEYVQRTGQEAPGLRV
jgi:ATPase subunit of ABC transporter with duplicated ATPase domains